MQLSLWDRPAPEPEPPLAPGSPTSAEAAESMRELTPRLRRRVYDHIAGCGSRGATRHELAAELGMPLSTVCGRAWELLRDGLVVERGARETPSRRKAAVLVPELVRRENRLEGDRQDRLVSDFVREFDGLSGSQKRSKVLDDAGMRRAKLSDLVTGEHLDGQRIAQLLEAMKRHTRPVKPLRLGVVGEDHLRRRLLDMGIVEESFEYAKKVSKEGVPWVLESAFGWLGDEAPDRRKIFAGANWSAAIKNPFRSFGGTGEGLETTLADMRATRGEPVIFALHLAHNQRGFTAVGILDPRGLQRGTGFHTRWFGPTFEANLPNFGKYIDVSALYLLPPLSRRICPPWANILASRPPYAESQKATNGHLCV